MKKRKAAITKVPVKKGGMPALQPTDEERQLVSLLAGNGYPQDRIALCISNRRGTSISEKTLQRAFPKELEAGAAEMDAITLGALMSAIKKEQGWAICWRMKNRMGWRDSQHQEISGPDGKPMVIGLQVGFVVPQHDKNGDVIEHKADERPKIMSNGSGRN